MPCTKIVAFDAQDGDCVLVRCLGEPTTNILIDGGRKGTEALVEQYLRRLPETMQQIDLFVVTHIDSDHLAGAIAIGNSPFLAQRIHRVWFNGPDHLNPKKAIKDLSFAEGLEFCRCIERQGWAWNDSFAKEAAVRPDDACPIIWIAKNVSLTVLAPTRLALERLGKNWDKAIAEKASEERSSIVLLGPPQLDVPALAQQEYVRDTGIVNGSSIGLLLRHLDHSVLLSADCPSEVLVEALKLIAADGNPLRINASKFPHHGAAKNFSPALAEIVDARHWIVPANGRHKHPNAASIARLLMASKKRHSPVSITFTGNHPEATIWQDARVQKQYGLTTSYRAASEGWITVSLDSEPTLA